MAMALVDGITRIVRLRDSRRLAYMERGRPDGFPILHHHGMPGSRLQLLAAAGVPAAFGLAAQGPTTLAVQPPAFETRAILKLGSVTHKVMQLVDVPVLIARASRRVPRVPSAVGADGPGATG